MFGLGPLEPLLRDPKISDILVNDIPYQHGDFKVTDIKARTIHADGTVIPLLGKPEDLLVSRLVDKNGNHTQFNRMVFTLPSVEVGSILEFRYDLGYSDNSYSSPFWEIQRPYFVHKAHYFFLPFKAFMPGIQNQTSSFLIDEHDRALNSLVWAYRLPVGVSVVVDGSGRYSVDLTDIPPTPEEEWMPPTQSVLYHVSFYYKPAGNAKEFWSSETKLWSKEVDHAAESSKAIKEAVAGLISPADSDLDKAKKLYQAVQALDNTDYTRKKSESELRQLNWKQTSHAEDTWRQKSGSSEEIAQLYLSMLRAAGLTANAMKVVDRERATVDTSYLSLSQFNDTLVILSTGGSDILLDPGEKMCPFGSLNWRHSGAGGIRQPGGIQSLSGSKEQIYPDNKITRIGDVTLDSQGAINASFRIILTGQEALYWRQKALANDEAEVKKQFDQRLVSIFPDGVEAHVDSFSGLDNPGVPLTANIAAQGNLGIATSRRMILPAYFFESRGAHPFVAQEKRQTIVDMHYGETVTDQVTYHLPAGFTVEGAPADAKISWPLHTLLITKTISAPGTITLVHSLARAFTFAKPEEYQDLRGFYQKVAAADQAQLVLAAAPPTPKGN